ncbi:hypothetical protein Glove_340g82 [Diversispora epigaea]|uniref:BACK domain-containing protein n=1 Tax=Diversispora epigaea TaxID=1348612 RepID=A0A397HMK4_9GLOM|nr:hypothetical protein Glove_340g82 [Diversispora epigaea]
MNKNHVITIIKPNISGQIFEIVLNNDFKGLKQFYNDIIAKRPNLFFESEDFTSLREAALVSVLKRDDLQLEEIEI